VSEYAEIHFTCRRYDLDARDFLAPSIYLMRSHLEE